MIISININENLNNALKHEAALMGCSRSNLIRIIIADYLSRNQMDITSYRNWLAFRRAVEKEVSEDGEKQIST